MKKIPMRKCLGCQERKPKNELYRIVKTNDGNIIVDIKGKTDGRGAYICSEECLKKSIKAKRFEKEFETEIEESIFEQLRGVIKGE